VVVESSLGTEEAGDGGWSAVARLDWHPVAMTHATSHTSTHQLPIGSVLWGLGCQRRCAAPATWGVEAARARPGWATLDDGPGAVRERRFGGGVLARWAFDVRMRGLGAKAGNVRRVQVMGYGGVKMVLSTYEGTRMRFVSSPVVRSWWWKNGGYGGSFLYW